jgi:hypothetical protein
VGLIVSCRKFSAVLGQMSSLSSIVMRPNETASPYWPSLISKYTWGLEGLGGPSGGENGVLAWKKEN